MGRSLPPPVHGLGLEQTAQRALLQRHGFLGTQLMAAVAADTLFGVDRRAAVFDNDGVGRAGARYRTQTMLRFQADHAFAQASVFSDVPAEFLESLHLPVYQTTCESREEFLTRPDKGRVFDADTLRRIRESIAPDVRVVVYVADGLSSAAVTANAADILPVIRKGLEGTGIKVNEPFFVRFGRVATMDQIGDGLPAEVVCVLLGERPGLVTAESMSAYIAYKPTVGMAESRRTVLANIHRGGTPAVEAGAHIVDLIRLMLEKKRSGIDLPV